MNWQRGLWRMWLVVTLLWIGFASWFADPIGGYNNIFNSNNPYYVEFGRPAQLKAFKFLLGDWMIFALLPPVILWALGAIAVWVLRGFKRP
jgi:hypothetical protein